MPRQSWKLTIDPDGTPTVIENDQVSYIKNVRPENGISSLTFRMSNIYFRYYSSIIQVSNEVDLAIKCELPSYTTVFSGIVHSVTPTLTIDGEMIEVVCWGWGIALDKTLCDTSFGTESANPTTDTPEEILDYIIANYVTKRFGPLGAATEWSMDTTDIDAPHADFSVTNLTSNYQTNLTLVSRLCDLINAHAVDDSDIGVHWYVDPDKHFRMKEIDGDSVDGDWTEYYKGSASLGIIKESGKILVRDYHVQLNDYYNSIILASAFRKPAYDHWTEDADTNNVWTIRDGDISLSDDAANYVVGADSLKLTIDASQIDAIYRDFPNNIDTSYIGSQNTIPTINFYAMRTSNANSSAHIGLYTTRGAYGAGDTFYIQIYNTASDTTWLPNASQWYGITIPIGPFYKNFAGTANTKNWNIANNADWTNIDGMIVYFNNTGFAGENYFWIDDLHLSGKIIRHAYDASEINAARKERMLLIRLDTALDDTLNTTDNTGTAAMLAEAELYKRTSISWTGRIKMELKEDLLPGQKIALHWGKQPDGTYYASANPVRTRKVTHTIDARGFKTVAEYTYDVTNCNTRGIANQYSLLMEHAGALGHGEAKDLKASGIDPLIPRLAWDPT